MTLTLKIRNFDHLDNGMPVEFVLNRRGAVIGRSPTCDWSLPDARNYISSRHCEVAFADGHYSLADVSTNGTFLNGAAERMGTPRRIAQGDMFLVGQYEVVAELSGEAVVAVERDQEAAAAASQSWGGWDAQAGAAPAPASAPSDGWGLPPSAPPAGGGNGNQAWAPASGPSLARPAAHRAHEHGAAPVAPPAGFGGGGWAPSARAPDIAVRSAWEEQIAPPDPASEWSSAAPDRPPSASPDDIWGKISEGNVVDWARGGFGQPVEEKRDPLGLNKPAPEASLPAPQPQLARFDNDPGTGGWGAIPAAPQPPATPQSQGAPAFAAPPPAPRPAAPAAPAATPRPAPPAAAVPPGESGPTALSPATSLQALEAFLGPTGINRDQLKDLSPATLTRAGALFRKLVAGLVVMVEARARAKSQMGAEATSLEFDGNNPIKFARTPEQAIAQLLNPAERGFMDGDRAVEDAFFDLQSHQMATLKAMQGALKATLDRFSPTAIRARAETKGLLSKIMPGARDAAMWNAYEREFSGVAQGSDEAFMDVFAKEFRKAYEEQARRRR